MGTFDIRDTNANGWNSNIKDKTDAKNEFQFYITMFVFVFFLFSFKVYAESKETTSLLYT